MKRLLIIVFSLYFLLSAASTASAHVLKTDGSVGAVIHMTPEDDPIAGEPTDFFFELKDKEGRFKPENCECKGSILQNGEEVYSQSLFQDNLAPSLQNASFSYTFPEKDVYQVQVSGKPKTPGAFNTFTLTWDVRVARESDKNAAASDINGSSDRGMNRYLPIFIVVVILLGVFIGTIVKHKGRGDTKK